MAWGSPLLQVKISWVPISELQVVGVPVQFSFRVLRPRSELFLSVTAGRCGGSADPVSFGWRGGVLVGQLLFHIFSVVTSVFCSSKSHRNQCAIARAQFLGYDFLFLVVALVIYSGFTASCRGAKRLRYVVFVYPSSPFWLNGDYSHLNR